jgi:DNA ligase D-like protein (predicted 3'-phosphoesterase)
LLFALLGATSYGFYQLSGPATDWMAKLPQSLHRLEAKVEAYRKPVETVRKAAEEVEKMARMDDGKGPPVVELKQPALLDSLLKGTQNFFAAGLASVLILYFLLATEDLFLRKVLKALPGLEKVRAGEVLRNAEQQISAYLLTITVINLCLGAVVGFLLYLLGMPNPVLCWALPKGPSLDPSVKRLAVAVEAHPLEYAAFEGVIPEGEYGAGTVMIWDRGTYMPEGDAFQSDLKRGELKFHLKGKKLKGSWVLIRTRRGASPTENHRSWLLIKHRDDAVAKEDITVTRPRSVLTNRLLAEIAWDEGGNAERASAQRGGRQKDEAGGAAAARCEGGGRTGAPPRRTGRLPGMDGGRKTAPAGRSEWA